MASRLIDGITYRRATISDYRGVIECTPDLFGGYDHLPWSYKLAAHTRDHYLYLAEDTNKVVGFTGAFIDHEGKALSSFGSRTAAAYEGRGVMAKLKLLMHETITELFPEIKVELTDAWLGEHATTILPKMMQKGYKIETKDVFAPFFNAEAERIKALLAANDKHPRNFRVLSPNLSFVNDNKGLVAAFLKEFGEYFIPGLTWIPLKVTPGNIRFTSTVSHIFVSYSDESKSKLNGVSFLSMHPCPANVRVNSVTYAVTDEVMFSHVHALCEQIAFTVRIERFGWNVLAQFLSKPDFVATAGRLEELLGERVPIRDDDPLDGMLFSLPINI